MADDITEFRGEYRFLSNFHVVPVRYKKQVWPTSEHAFQAAKSTCEINAQHIKDAATPGQAKRRGRTLHPELMRKDWDEVKRDIMYDIVRRKFRQNPELMKLLKATAPRQIIEGNTWGDTFWGVCNGKGENNLGKILMEIRDE